MARSGQKCNQSHDISSEDLLKPVYIATSLDVKEENKDVYKDGAVG